MNYERANHRWDDARDAQLEAMWNDGVPIADIAVRMFTTAAAIGDRRFALKLPIRKTAMGWSDERTERAKALWLAGRSANEIAMILNCGLSRNAVIGKIHRLGLSKHGRAACAAPAPDMRKRAFKAPKVLRTHVKPPKPSPQNKPAVIIGGYSVSSESQRIERAAEGQAANDKVAAGGGVESPNARPWMESRRMTECNWPIGERHAIMSCCNPVKARGWCAGHYKLGTAPTQPAGLRPRDATRLTRFDRVETDGPRTARRERSLWDDAREAA